MFIHANNLHFLLIFCFSVDRNGNLSRASADHTEQREPNAIGRHLDASPWPHPQTPLIMDDHSAKNAFIKASTSFGGKKTNGTIIEKDLGRRMFNCL